MTDASLDLWTQHGSDNEWKMPSAPWWKRLWGIRHLRTIWIGYQVYRHGRSVGMIPNGYDQWVLYGMWRGWEGRRDD